MARVRDFWVRAALALSLALIVYFAGAALGAKFGLIPWTLGYSTLSVQWGPWLLAVAVVVGLAASALAFTVAPRRGGRLALTALLLPALGLGYALHLRKVEANTPPIHDISTDTADPPAFSPAVSEARAALPDGNSLDLIAARVPDHPSAGPWAGMRVTQVQQAAYPEIASIPTGLSPAAAFDHALAVARGEGWRLGAVDRQAGRIEATARTFWYGFVDDIIIRVRSDGSGARIDMRAARRVGDSDGGANARRVQAYLSALRARLEEAES